MKRTLAILALVVLACLIVLVTLPKKPIVTSMPNSSGGPSFEVRVIKPRAARPLFGLIPGGQFGLPPDEICFDQNSSGFKVDYVEENQLALSGEGWRIMIETDEEGRISPATHIIFPMELGGKDRNIRCVPGDPVIGYLRTAQLETESLKGHFLIEFPSAKDADSGRTLKWPPAPLTVTGRFTDLNKRVRSQPQSEP